MMSEPTQPTLDPSFVNTQHDSTSSDDWYTPPEFFESMQITFDLDVCAPVGGVAWIPAKKHYTIHDDSLSQPWHGRVWMNPPFSNPRPFVERWITHSNGIALIPFTKARWFRTLWDSSASFALWEFGAIRFVRMGERKQVFMPCLFAAIGPKENHDAIRRLGPVR